MIIFVRFVLSVALATYNFFTFFLASLPLAADWIIMA